MVKPLTGNQFAVMQTVNRSTTTDAPITMRSSGRPPWGIMFNVRHKIGHPQAEMGSSGRWSSWTRALKAYEAARVDALMAPGLPDLESVRAVRAATTKPFNFMAGIKGKSFTVSTLTAAGVKRISLATSLYRAAMTGLLNAAKEVRENGTFGYIDTSISTPDMNAFLRG
jgi:hypothetical protein